MKKKRIRIPDDISALVLFESDHTCCKCNSAGRPVQIHHIDEDPSNNEQGNLAVLCLLCHNQTMVKGGFGRRLDATLVVKYREEWIKRVSTRRSEADRIAIQNGLQVILPNRSEEIFVNRENHKELEIYVLSLPGVLDAYYKAARPEWDSGVSARMNQGAYNVIDGLERMLVNLAGWYPDNHFSLSTPEEYFSEFISQRFQWFSGINEPEGYGTDGTIVGQLVAGNVMHDLQNSVKELAMGLFDPLDEFDCSRWIRSWNAIN